LISISIIFKYNHKDNIILVKRVKKTQKVPKAKKIFLYSIEIKIFGTEPSIDKNIKFCDQCGAKNRISAQICKNVKVSFGCNLGKRFLS